MAYEDLLPDVDDLRRALVEDGKLTGEQANSAMHTFAWFIQEQADYAENSYKRDGDKRDLGAQEELNLIARNLRFASGHGGG